jgi:hypothetical protein
VAPTTAGATQKATPFTEKEVFGNEALTMGDGYMERRNASIAKELSDKYKTDDEIQTALIERITPGMKSGEGVTDPNASNTYKNIYEQIQKLRAGGQQEPQMSATGMETEPQPLPDTGTKTEGML